MGRKYDFGGYATKNDLLCADGRVIRRDAFKDNDGQTVPLVYMHEHHDPQNVLGHALLENRKDGVYAYCSFNDTDNGKYMKECVEHGDITSLSIYANKLIQKGKDVVHGAIREVSIVLAGANPGAYIDNPVLVHGEGTDEETWSRDDTEAVIFSDSDIELYHADDHEGDEGDDEREEQDMSKDNERTVQDVIDSMTDEQREAMYYVIGEVLDQARNGDVDDEDYDEDYDEDEDEDMKHNVFDSDYKYGDHLSHDDMNEILNDAKRLGSLREAVEAHMESGVLAHSDGIEYATGEQTYGFNDPDMLFPDARAFSEKPEWIKRDTEWVTKVLHAAHHSPFSRVKSLFANITEDEARAKGYLKGHLKKEEVFSLLKRTTSPQTIYKKQKMDRDDVVDITGFDVIAWIKSEMRVMLDEELARSALVGDGRLPSSDDKISEDHIRPIYNDADLFTVKALVNVASTATADDKAKAVIRAAIKSRKDYKGSGNPTLFTTEDYLTDMLLLEDNVGRPLYPDQAALARKLRVKEIVTVPVMENITDTDKGTLFGIIVNMSDYNFGADNGGSVNMFDDFDIDYNQQKYLIETRCSGALTKPYSAIALWVKTTAAAGGNG